MPYEQKDGDGVLFKNDRKETDQHPDYRGNIMLNGVDHWLDAWINTSQKGQKYMKVRARPKDRQSAPQRSAEDPYQRPAPPEPAPAGADLDDEVPF